MSYKFEKKDFSHPYDNIISGGLRFFVEIIAWITGPWYLAGISYWLVIPVLIFLVGLPAIFSTVNDKRRVIIPTRGSIRVLIELMLYLVAFVAPWYVLSMEYSIFTSVIVATSLLIGAPRLIWLLKGAPCV